MIFPGRLVSFIASTDLDVSSMFYVDTLGCELLARDASALVVDGGGTTLRITVVQDKHDVGHTVLGWNVEHLNSVVGDMRARGIVFVQYPGLSQDDFDAWSAPNGSRIAWFRDPHGNVLSLIESGT